MLKQGKLGRYFGAADDGGERPLGFFERAGQRLDLFLHRASRRRRQQRSETCGRGMRAVRDREGIVDIDIAERGEFFCESGIVFLLAGMETCVLQHQDLARVERLDCRRGFGTDAILGERDRLAPESGQRRDDRLQRIVGIGLAGRAGRNETKARSWRPFR